jgi:hypothetical protein
MDNQSKALKEQAKNLHAALKARGDSKPLSYAQELIAAQYGQPNWDTLMGVLYSQAHPQLRLKDLPENLIPDELFVERGTLQDTLNVVGWEEDLIRRADSLEELTRFLEDNSELFPQGLQTQAICLEGDGFDLEITAEELAAGCHKHLGGKDYWFLPKKEWYLQFVYASTDGWTNKSQAPALAVPQVVRSLKGVRMLTLRSSYGPLWSLHVLVPAHLRVETIGERISQELKRLKELDREHEDGPGYQEYTEEDIRRFVSTLGCAVIDSEASFGPWD